MITTSYKTFNVKNFITSFVKLIDPATVIEIGVQQGNSASCILEGMSTGSCFDGYDLFEEKYSLPPFMKTHSNKEIALAALQKYNHKRIWNLWKGNHKLALTHIGSSSIDLLHVDICNHYDNLLPILKDLLPKTNKAVLLEGGNVNHWQQKYNYKPYKSMLYEPWITNNWDHVTLSFDKNQALTILSRKEV